MQVGRAVDADADRTRWRAKNSHQRRSTACRWSGRHGSRGSRQPARSSDRGDGGEGVFVVGGRQHQRLAGVPGDGQLRTPSRPSSTRRRTARPSSPSDMRARLSRFGQVAVVAVEVAEGRRLQHQQAGLQRRGEVGRVETQAPAGRRSGERRVAPNSRIGTAACMSCPQLLVEPVGPVSPVAPVGRIEPLREEAGGRRPGAGDRRPRSCVARGSRRHAGLAGFGRLIGEHSAGPPSRGLRRAAAAQGVSVPVSAAEAFEKPRHPKTQKIPRNP